MPALQIVPALVLTLVMAMTLACRRDEEPPADPSEFRERVEQEANKPPDADRRRKAHAGAENAPLLIIAPEDGTQVEEPAQDFESLVRESEAKSRDEDGEDGSEPES